MKQFDLSVWFQDKSRKVMTRTGEPVEIINYEVKGDYCIYAKASWQDGETFNICTTSNGEAYKGEETAYDLFFADEEEELTEFEKHVQAVMMNCGLVGCIESYKDIDAVKVTSKHLLDLARKEIKGILTTDAYNQGREDALKDLPKWKKAKKNEELDCHVAIQQDDRVVLSDFVQKDEYYITLDVLKRLPKEE